MSLFGLFGGAATPAVTATAPALSELSATEFVTLARLGFYPRGLVTGVSVYDAGFDLTGLTLFTQELTQLGKTMHLARAAAVERMRRQAEAHGAEGVVGVRLDVDHHRWRGGHMVVRFFAVGTAIGFDPERAPTELAGSPSLKVNGRPFTSDLSGHDFVSLLRYGYRPVSLAFGNCVYGIGVQMPMFLKGNTELTGPTQAFQNARETAMQSLMRDLDAEFGNGPDRPSGIVGMSVQEGAHAGEARVIEYTAVGTAVAPLAANDPRKAPSLPVPRVVVPVDV